VVTVNLAGEPLTADLVGSLYALPGVRRVMNLYGPTETTTYSSFAVAGKGKPGSVPIGVGIEGTVVYVLDRNLAPAVPGELGEICIGGLGVARGILGDAVTTARRFLPDPFSPQPGARMYRTGDMARVGPDRSLVFSGRMDDQVKIRGVRVELQEVETTLREFPGVADAAVLPRGGDGVEIAAYVVPRTGWGDDDLLAQEQIRHWRSVYDENYGVTSMDPRFDTRGWVSRFSGRPYDLVDMREWVDGTAGRIRALGGRRILEIGCGTGLLLFALLDRASAYDATDFSQAALEGIRRGLTAEEACKVRLFHCDAGDLSALPGDSYDVVVINSVVQYLPRVGDVIALLDAAHGKLAPGGRLFVGDVRNAELLETLHFAVQLAQAPPEDDVRDVVVRGREKVRNDAELALSPAFFAVWARRKQGVRARLMARTGPSLTEMNLYRYDVVLGPADPPAEPPRIHPWSAESELDVEEIARRSAAKGETVVLSDVPDGRLAALVSLVEEEVATGPGRPRTVRGVREGLARGLVAGVDLVSVLEAVGRGGCEADVTPHDSRGRCSLVLWAKGIGAPPTCWTGEEGLALHSLGNDPLSPRRDARLAAALREHLSRRLPEAMIPTVLLIVLEMPRTPGGKVDRGALHALGAPARPKSEYRAPSTPLESELALIFADLLRVDRVGVDDDFFELGGHSLLATQLVSRIRERYGANLPLRRVFEIPSVRGLAQALSEEAAVGAPAGAEEEEEGEL
jgi:acyl-CoA synthetase (AMP-forming)/AMP-acid ligase II/acyl carrier protein/precorrin-6B methylase 2